MSLPSYLRASLCLAVLAACTSDEDGSDTDPDAAYNGYQFTVTGPRSPDGWRFEIPADEADPFVGTSIIVTGTSLGAIDTNGSDAELNSITMDLRGTEPDVYTDDIGSMSLAISIPGEDGVNIGSDDYLGGDITITELTDERFAGTIDVLLNDTGIDSEGDVYEVVGSFDLQE